MQKRSNTSVTAQLLGLESTKTWSLIVTLFGDLDGDALSGKELRSLLDPLGIKPEAMRVALHRLKKDGWIVSQKTGREVTYRLSGHARQETNAAQTDVYRRDVKFPEGWRVVLPAPGKEAIHGPHVALDKGLILSPKSSQPPKAALELSLIQGVPSWLEGFLVQDHLREQAASLSDLAAHFLSDRAAVDTVTARLMFLHYWRKMALRTGTWAHIGLMPDGVMARCHSAIADVLEHTQRTRPTP